MDKQQDKRRKESLQRTMQKMREFAKVYNNIKLCPLKHDLIRILFPGSTIKNKDRLLQRSVDSYQLFRAKHVEYNLPELELRSHRDGSWIGIPDGVKAQLAEFRFDTRKLRRAKGVIITAAQFGATLNTSFWQSLQHYSAHRNFPLLTPAVKYGPVMTKYQEETKQRVLTSTFPEELKGHMVFEDLPIAGGMLNLNVTRLRPTLNRFLSDPICERGGNVSQIFAAPKLELEHRPRLQHDYPKAIMTTGAVTHPAYQVDNTGQRDKAGEIAYREHTYAAIIVEFVGRKTFHFRQLLANTEGEFYDIDPVRGGGVFVTPSGVTHDPDAVDTAALGDYHIGSTHPVVREVTFQDMLPKLKPKNVFLQDLFDGSSISHWDEAQVSRQAIKAGTGHNSLRAELDAMIAELKWMQERLPSATFHSVASNHNDFLLRYMEGKRWLNDPVNITIASRIFADLQEELEQRKAEHGAAPMHPVDYWINQYAPGVIAHDRKSTMLVPEAPDAKKILVTMHGDLGPSGMRGAGMAAFRKLNQWCIIGHTHSAAILGPVWRVGTSTHLSEHYVNGPTTNWTHTHAVVYRNGQRQLLNIVNGTWHGQTEQRRRRTGEPPKNAKRKAAPKKASRRNKR